MCVEICIISAIETYKVFESRLVALKKFNKASRNYATRNVNRMNNKSKIKTIHILKKLNKPKIKDTKYILFMEF